MAVLAALARAGKRVLKPFADHRYDLAYEEDGALVKVQCKTGVVRNGVISFPTCSISRHGVRHDYRKDADYFGVYCHDRSEVYLVPVEEVPLRLAHLRVEPPRNGQKAGVRFAAQYLLSKNWQSVGDDSPMRPAPSLDRRSSILTDVDVWPTLPGMAATEIATVEAGYCCVPLNAPDISDGDITAAAALFKALGDPHRVRIVNLLATAPAPVCVCDIAAAIGLTQPTTTFHLKKLAAAGLLHREQRGVWAFYSIDPDAWQRLDTVVKIKEVAR